MWRSLEDLVLLLPPNQCKISVSHYSRHSLSSQMAIDFIYFKEALLQVRSNGRRRCGQEGYHRYHLHLALARCCCRRLSVSFRKDGNVSSTACNTFPIPAAPTKWCSGCHFACNITLQVPMHPVTAHPNITPLLLSLTAHISRMTESPSSRAGPRSHKCSQQQICWIGSSGSISYPAYRTAKHDFRVDPISPHPRLTTAHVVYLYVQDDDKEEEEENVRLGRCSCCVPPIGLPNAYLALIAILSRLWPWRNRNSIFLKSERLTDARPAKTFEQKNALHHLCPCRAQNVSIQL